MSLDTTTSYNRPLHWFAVLTAFVTFLLIGLGGLVTSHGAGMSVPDWPNTYGYNMFTFPISKWVGGIFYEHTHRLLASAVGLLTTIVALWIFGEKSRPFMRWAGLVLFLLGIIGAIFSATRIEKTEGVLCAATGLVAFVAHFFWPRCKCSPKWMCWLAVLAFFGVIAQGILGGLRVTLHMDSLGIFHATIAQLFLILLCAIAVFTSRFWFKLADAQRRVFVSCGLRNLVLTTTILVFLQLIVAATMRHQHAGLAISDFPRAYGQWWPDMSETAVARYNAQRIEITEQNPITAFQIGLQMVHRIIAGVIGILIFACALFASRRLGGKDALTKLAWFWVALILIQIGLGAWTIWSNKAADVATLHVMGGALSLVTGALWCIIAFRRSAVPQTEASAAFTARTALAANNK